MTAKEKKINDFSTSLRLLIADYKANKEELKRTKDELKVALERCNQLSVLLSASERDYQNLKMVRMITVGDGDIEQAKQRVAKLIRDVNRCITLLNKDQ